MAPGASKNGPFLQRDPNVDLTTNSSALGIRKRKYKRG